MRTASFFRLEVEDLDVESFEIHGSNVGVFVLDSDPGDTDPEGVDSRVAGCTEPIRACSGVSVDACDTADFFCTVECGPPITP
ncbi:MAG TPA: hypothetical protein VFQ39_14940 [Longimicrobium sp.]|nr:hypothetical protein [Longimicrobium sp.]